MTTLGPAALLLMVEDLAAGGRRHPKRNTNEAVASIPDRLREGRARPALGGSGWKGSDPGISTSPLRAHARPGRRRMKSTRTSRRYAALTSARASVPPGLAQRTPSALTTTWRFRAS